MLSVESQGGASAPGVGTGASLKSTWVKSGMRVILPQILDLFEACGEADWRQRFDRNRSGHRRHGDACYVENRDVRESCLAKFIGAHECILGFGERAFTLGARGCDDFLNKTLLKRCRGTTSRFDLLK